MISAARMSRKQRHNYFWGAGKAPKREFDEGIRRRDGQLPWVDLFNRLVVHGTNILDHMVENRVGPFQVASAWSQILDDLDLWAEATGERLAPRLLGRAEEQALECWLWETHDRKRQDGRRKPNKSPERNTPTWPLISVGRAKEMELRRALAEAGQDILHQVENLLDRWQLETGKRLAEFPVRRSPYWRGTGGLPIRHGLSMVKRALPDADDLDRLAMSAAVEAV
jgi:hypothetical protein